MEQSTSTSNAAAAPSQQHQQPRTNRNRKRKGGRGGRGGGAAAATPRNTPAAANAAAVTHSHDQPHSHSHGHGHGHNHGAASSKLDMFGAPDMDARSEAVHYCDVLWHYYSYCTHSFARVERMWDDFQTQPSSLQRLAPGFPQRLGKIRAAIRANHHFISEIVSHRYIFQHDGIEYDRLEEFVARTHPIDEERMSKVRSTIRQCVRDWSQEGEAERAACYGPILAELEQLYPSMDDRKGVRVLVPGSGLGRLVWEVAHRGFEAQGNEFSYFMLLCSFLILNCCKERNIFTIYPYVHESKNLVNVDDQLRSVSIPDANPSLLPAQGNLSMAAGDWMDIFSDLPSTYIHGAFERKLQRQRKERERQIRMQRRYEERKRVEQAAAGKQSAAAAGASSASASAAAAASPTPATPATATSTIDDEDPIDDFIPDPPRSSSSSADPSSSSLSSSSSNANSWDVFASCYFIDCANSILEFIRTIAYILKPGGYWLNFGPLLYHYSDMVGEVSVELCWEEIRAAMPHFGLRLLKEALFQPSSYTSDERSMLRQQYFCVSCTVQKVGMDKTMNPLAVKQMQNIGANSVGSVEEEDGEKKNDGTEQSAVEVTSVTNANPAWVTLGVDVSSPLATSILVAGGHELQRGVDVSSSQRVDLYSIQATQLAPFLMQAVGKNDQVHVGKINVQGKDVLAILQRQQQSQS